MGRGPPEPATGIHTQTMSFLPLAYELKKAPRDLSNTRLP